MTMTLARLAECLPHIYSSRVQGSLPDQAALYGVLLKIHRLGLALIGLESSDNFHEAPKALYEKREQTTRRAK